jgi:hypothetical protein
VFSALDYLYLFYHIFCVIAIHFQSFFDKNIAKATEKWYTKIDKASEGIKWA